MLTFWLALALMVFMIITALLFYAFDLSRKVDIDAASLNSSPMPFNVRDKNNIDLFQQRLSELTVTRDSGEINQSTYDELSNEAKKQLLSDVELKQHQTVIGQQKKLFSSDRVIIFLIALLIPISTAFVYFPFGLSLGSLDQWRVVNQLKVFEQAKGSSQQQQAMDDLLLTLESQTTSLRPDNKLLDFLAGAYRSLGQYNRASVTYEKILKSEVNDPEIMAQLVEVLYLQRLALESSQHSLSPQSGASDFQEFTPRMTRLLEQALTINPDQPNALSLSGINAFRREQYDQATEFWQRALVFYNPRSNEAVTLQSSIRAAQQRINPDIHESQQQFQARPQSAIRINVSIDRSLLTAHESMSTPVFIFARPVTGTRMPLAAKRITLADLPITLTLTNLDKMAARSISDVKQVIVGARLARSGQPMASEGDLESSEQQVQVIHASVTGKPILLSTNDLAAIKVISLKINQLH